MFVGENDGLEFKERMHFPPHAACQIHPPQGELMSGLMRLSNLVFAGRVEEPD